MLEAKVSQLKHKGLEAVRLAVLWEQYIDLHGPEKATAFYKSIGLNHLETKSIEWEGLTLSRQPTEAEKLCVKSISQAQDAGKASVTKVLLQVRTALIDDALKAVKKLSPATYHELILAVPNKSRGELRDDLEGVFKKGRALVAAELRSEKEAAQHILTEGDIELLDEMTDVTVSRVVNDVQAKIAEAVARYRLLGLRGKELWDAVDDEMARGSVAYIDRLARGASSNVLNFGRFREAEDRKDEWERVEYSAILDPNVCESCAAEDGQSASNESDLQPAPNPECDGGDWCRCFHVYILDTVA